MGRDKDFPNERDKGWIIALLSTPEIDLSLVKLVMYKCGYDDLDTPIKRVQEWIDYKYGMSKEDWMKENQKVIENEGWE